MQSSVEHLTCPRCGARVNNAVAEAMCLRCLLELAMGASRPGPASQQARICEPRTFGDYDLFEVIGIGGMGVIWRARQRKLNREVALKMVRAGLMASENDRKRFMAEAGAVALLDHPNIVSIHEVGECDGNLFFSMRLIEGRSLAELIESKKAGQSSSWPSGAFPAAEAAKLVIDIARAVHHAHQRGVLHRDLKPGNILIDDKAGPQVTDFGLAKLAGEDSGLTLSGTVLGTPNYMAPEQASAGNRQLTTAADIYSLGAILYELLSGRPPFQAETAVATLRQVIDTDAPPPSSINREADRQLEVVALKCLAKEPARRYVTAAELADDLERWLRHEPILARPVSSGERLVLWARRHPAVAALSLLAAGLFALGSAGVLWQWREADSKATALARSSAQLLQEKKRAEEALWASRLSQARALRQSGKPGGVNEAMEAIVLAARYRPSLELRNEAIATLCSLDIGPEEILRPVSNSAPHMSGNPWSLSVDPKLQHVTHVTGDGAVECVRVSDGAVVATFPGSAGNVAGPVVWSESGKYLSFGSMAKLRVFELSSQRMVQEIQGEPMQGLKWPLAFSVDEQKVFASVKGEGVIYDLNTGLEVKRLGKLERVRHAAFHPRQPWISVALERSVQIWDWESGKLVDTFAPAGIGATLNHIAWRPDGRALAGAFDDGAVFVLDATSVGHVPLRYHLLRGHFESVLHIAFDHTGRQLLCCARGGITSLLNAYNWQGETILTRTRGYGVQFSPDGGHVAFLRPSEGVDIRPVSSPSAMRTLAGPVGYAYGLWDMTFSADGRWLAGGSWDGLFVWDTQAGWVVAKGKSIKARKVVFSPGGQTILTCGPEGGILRWPWNTSTNASGETKGWLEEPKALVLPKDARPSLACMCPEADKLLVGTEDGQVLEYGNAAPGVPGVLLTVPGMQSLALTPDGKTIATSAASGEGTCLWDGSDGHLLRKINDAEAEVGFSPKGEWLVISTQTDHSLWDMASNEIVKVITRESGNESKGQHAFLPDGGMLAVNWSTSEARLISMDTFEPVASITVPNQERIERIKTSPDGRWLVLLTTRRCYLYDLPLLRHELAALRLDW